MATEQTRQMLVAALAALCLMAGAASAKGGDATANKLKGQMVISDEPLPPTDDADKFLDAVKRWGKLEIAKPKESDTWSLHVVAFPEKKPGTPSLALLLFDVTGGKHDYLTRKDINSDPNATILVFDVDITQDDGIKLGNAVEIDLTRIDGATETTLAKSKMTFR